MSKTIADYTAAVTIDGTNDYLLIEPSGNTVYKKINRSVLLGITGSPLGTSDSQNVTNKTLNNTNTVTLKDSLFTLQDDGDATKQAQFQLSGITAGQTRTYTMPNASVTLASLSGTETLTNKTITSPVITGGTIDNSTVTVDSISGHTSATIVTVANLQISNGVLNSANSVTATSIADAAIRPQALIAGTGSSWAWQTWTPTFVNWTVGAGTTTARYTQIGKKVFFTIESVLGAGFSVGSGVTFTFPVTAASGVYSANHPLGVVRLTPAASPFNGAVIFSDTTHGGITAWGAAGSYVNEAGITATIPGTWAANDRFQCSGYYEAA